MPFFRILIHGQGKIAGGRAGFYTTRWCYAATQREGGAETLERVRNEWDDGRYATLKRGPLSLQIEDAYPISLFGIWKTSNRDYAFYPSHGESEPTHAGDAGIGSGKRFTVQAEPV